MEQNITMKSGLRTTGEALKAACLGSCERVLEQVARVRESMFGEWRTLLAAREQVLHLALNEAEALAWQTEVPHLVFPVLAEEKVRALARWNVRQQRLNSGRDAVFTA